MDDRLRQPLSLAEFEIGELLGCLRRFLVSRIELLRSIKQNKQAVPGDWWLQLLRPVEQQTDRLSTEKRQEIVQERALQRISRQMINGTPSREVDDFKRIQIGDETLAKNITAWPLGTLPGELRRSNQSYLEALRRADELRRQVFTEMDLREDELHPSVRIEFARLMRGRRSRNKRQ